jgi:hypothetical protein
MKQLLKGVVAASARLLHLAVNKWEAVWWVCKGQPRFKSATLPPLPSSHQSGMLRAGTRRVCWELFETFEHIFNNLFCNKRDGRGQRRLLFFLQDLPAGKSIHENETMVLRHSTEC